MMPRAPKPKVNVTKNYRLFGRSAENRPLDMKAHKKLEQSMKQYGFLSCFPIVCYRDGKGLIVKDGQHRLAIAETLGLPVYWMEEETDFDVAIINCTPKTWKLKDYAQKYAAQGKESYQSGLEFAEQYELPIGISFAMLAGTTTFGNIQDQFTRGDFKIKDSEWAYQVAGIYGPFKDLSPEKHNAQLLGAFMGVCRVPEFDPKRLLQNAKRCREKIVSYSTKDAYLEMIEEIYNFGRKTLVPLKIMAANAMRNRNVAKKQGR